MVDVDWLAIEYDEGRAMALVEYKHERAEIQWANHPSYRALCDLGNRAGVPVFAVRYAEDFSWWRVTALNATGRAFVPQRVDLTEEEYVALLYRVRGRTMPADLFVNLTQSV